jgi:hypothetical protein
MLGPRTLEKRKALRVLIHAGNTARDRGLVAVPEDGTADIPRRHHHTVRTTSISPHHEHLSAPRASLRAG